MLVGQLPPGVKKEVEKWKLASGMDVQPTEDPSKVSARKSKGKSKGNTAKENIRSLGEWG